MGSAMSAFGHQWAVVDEVTACINCEAEKVGCGVVTDGGQHDCEQLAETFYGQLLREKAIERRNGWHAREAERPADAEVQLMRAGR